MSLFFFYHITTCPRVGVAYSMVGSVMVAKSLFLFLGLSFLSTGFWYTIRYLRYLLGRPLYYPRYPLCHFVDAEITRIRLVITPKHRVSSLISISTTFRKKELGLWFSFPFPSAHTSPHVGSCSLDRSAFYFLNCILCAL